MAPLRRLHGPVLATLIAAGCATGPVATGAPDALDAPAVTDQSSMAPIVTPEPFVEPLATPEPTLAPVVDVAPERTVEESGGFRLTTLSSAACTADAPFDWAMTAPDRSDRADVWSPDGSMYAGYGIQAINTALAAYAGAYQAPLNDPDLYSTDPGTVAVAHGRIIVGAIGGASDIVVQDVYQPTQDYLLAIVSGSTHDGAVFFHASGFPGDGVNYAYALPMYFAFTTSDRWESMGALVARVAASIRCSTQFQPPDDYFTVEAGTAGDAGDANGDEYGYNPQLGTEYAYDPATGTNYLVDPSANWSDTGPDGPGYYVLGGGGDYRRLEPGRID